MLAKGAGKIFGTFKAKLCGNLADGELSFKQQALGFFNFELDVVSDDRIVLGSLKNVGQSAFPKMKVP